ncbi:MAG: type III pantothenate kinase [Thermodesulfobacteriota bacterium]|nr:type III pantothenate kinase [Thermodesulfobacteriota bacterium]
MLLVVDVGNTNTVLGLFAESTLQHSWRIRTDYMRTVDEYAMLINDLTGFSGIRLSDIKDVIISCVVPPLVDTLERMSRKYFAKQAYVVGSEMKMGMAIHYDNPADVGADRIVNAVAAYKRYLRSLIVVDFGTATTFDCISPEGAYCGGAIAPGLGISADALHVHASKLPRVEICKPPKVVAKNTVNSMQSGLLYGYAGLVDGLVQRMKYEVGGDPLVVATGGLAERIAQVSETIDEVEPMLTLEGLFLLYNLNK